MNKNDIRRALIKSRSPEEAAAILRENGVQISDEDAGKLYDTIHLYYSLDTTELSDDELNAISGGNRDYATEGCAATVEPGSECWGTDGGCAFVNITYTHPPTTYCCRKCGAHVYTYEPGHGIYRYVYRCPRCGSEYGMFEYVPSH